jgi:hypothetical protein
MTAEEVIELIRSVKEDFEREEDQGLLQRDLHKAEMALAGKYACERVLRAVEARSGIRLIGDRKMSRAR